VGEGLGWLKDGKIEGIWDSIYRPRHQIGNKYSEFFLFIDIVLLNWVRVTKILSLNLSSRLIGVCCLQERDHMIQEELIRLEKLQRLAEKIQQEAKITDSKLDDIEAWIEDEVHRFLDLKSAFFWGGRIL
jgi:hypothetical protein